MVDLSKVIFDMDMYKYSMPNQYPEGILNVFSGGEARGSEIEGIDYTIFFGLQPILMNLAKQITSEDVDYAAKMIPILGASFPEEKWRYIVEKHNGYLPLKIRAVAEGTKIPVKNTAFTIEATDENCAWLTTVPETKLMRVWYPTSTATISYAMREMVKESMMKTMGNDDGIQYILSDFGSRGATSCESSALGGLGYLTSFKGSDNTQALLQSIQLYGATPEMASLDASEHSTITSWGRDGELDAYRNMIKQFGDKAIFACVSDSYDIDVAVRDMWCGVLKDEVKQMNAKLIVRPDSGDAIENIRKILHYLDDAFGSIVNEKGYKVLNKVGIINGDGVSINSLPLMLKAVEDEGFATCNVAYGIGGAMIQECNRDTFKYAIKCSAMMNKEGKWMDVYKDPKNSFKKSKRGLTGLYFEVGNMVTKSTDYDTMNSDLNLLKPVFENGKILKTFTLDEIRATISNQ